MREPARANLVLACQLRQVMCGGLAFHGGIRGDDQFLHLTLGQARGKAVEAEFTRTNPVQWRQPPLQDEIQAAIARCLLDGKPVGRRFDRTQQIGIPRSAGAGGAHFGLAEVAAAGAVADLLDGRGQRLRQPRAAVPVTLEHVVGHALGRLRPDARQHAQGFDQLFEQHTHEVTLTESRSRKAAPRQNGSFIPGGNCMPAVAADIFACDSSSILFEASLNAAAIRSSTISWSDSTLGSMRTLRHSLRPVSVTVTMPPPAEPVASIFAISSCARCRFSCMRWACCIIWAMLPRIVLLS